MIKKIEIVFLIQSSIDNFSIYNMKRNLPSFIMNNPQKESDVLLDIFPKDISNIIKSFIPGRSVFERGLLDDYHIHELSEKILGHDVEESSSIFFDFSLEESLFDFFEECVIVENQNNELTLMGRKLQSIVKDKHHDICRLYTLWKIKLEYLYKNWNRRIMY